MFEKRLRAYSALVYACEDSARNNASPIPERSIEYDEELIGGVEDTE